MYDENIDILYILNVTISMVHLYLLFHNFGSEDNLLGFITIIFFFQNELLSKVWFTGSVHVTLYEIVNHWACA